MSRSEHLRNGFEEARVHTYWETVRLIDQHLLYHQDRAEYGAAVIRRLGEDLDI